MKDHLGLFLHVQVDNGGLQRDFSDRLRKESSTWWISKTGHVERGRRQAGVGAGRRPYNSVETEGCPDELLTDDHRS